MMYYTKGKKGEVRAEDNQDLRKEGKLEKSSLTRKECNVQDWVCYNTWSRNV